MDLSAIHQLVRRARLRIRFQSALEAFTVALIPASWLVVGAAATARWGPPEGATALLVAACAALTGAVLVGVMRPLDDETIARRIDRASGLADRLSSAIAFSDDEAGSTSGFKQLAIADGIRVAERARMREATPLMFPRYGSAALLSIAIAATVELALPAAPSPVAIDDEVEVAEPLDSTLHWDVDYAEHMVARLRVIAMQTDEPQLVEAADDLALQLRDLAGGRITKDQLLARLGLLDSTVDHELSTNARIALDDSRDAIQRLTRDVPPHPLDEKPLLGDEQPRIEMPKRDVELPSPPAPRHRAIIEAAAVRGFAGAEYQKVYTQYMEHNEDVMHPEAMPSSRRSAIRRYFDRIRPH